MTWWKQWTRKRDGWVERKRRFQEQVAEGFREVTGQETPALAPVPVSETVVPARDRGAK